MRVIVSALSVSGISRQLVEVEACRARHSGSRSGCGAPDGKDIARGKARWRRMALGQKRRGGSSSIDPPLGMATKKGFLRRRNRSCSFLRTRLRRYRPRIPPRPPGPPPYGRTSRIHRWRQRWDCQWRSRRRMDQKRSRWWNRAGSEASLSRSQWGTSETQIFDPRFLTRPPNSCRIGTRHSLRCRQKPGRPGPRGCSLYKGLEAHLRRLGSRLLPQPAYQSPWVLPEAVILQ